MSNGRLLIMDDDHAIGRAIGFMAESVGLQYRAVTLPGDFFRQLETWDPTHIVLDLVMPEMDGVEIMRRLADRACKARIIISSGVEGRVRDAAQRAAAEHDLNVIGALSKPFRTDQLRALMAKAGAAHSNGLPATSGSRLDVSEGALWSALTEEEFHLVYQPKICCASRELVGFEALVRWQHPEAGMILPDQFIPRAESAGLIDRLTEQVLQQGIRWIKDAPPASGDGARELSLAVNLSARTLLDFQFADLVAGLCREAGFEPGRLTLELTETAAMEDPVLALDMMTRLRMKGFQLSIDDFGTGYSSLLQLSRLPFSEIKIDKSFVMSAPYSEESRTIIKSIVGLGHNLGLKTVAEGVEDQETLDLLEAIGCDIAQGFHIARPMDGGAVAGWISEWNSQSGLAEPCKRRHRDQAES